tara:strand:+ start:1383 stop:2672 length:1290 start_codon:yes stop_codon:yes gene_type:complete
MVKKGFVLNVNFINTGKSSESNKEYRLDRASLNEFSSLIKELTSNIYSYQMTDSKIREILNDNGKKWKVYAFGDLKKNGVMGIESIVIYRLILSEKTYEIYNLYQIGSKLPKTDSIANVEKFMKDLNNTIVDSMKELNIENKKRKIFYENIRESNILYNVYDNIQSENKKEIVKVKRFKNGIYKDGESKILILMRLMGKKKFKIFDDLNSVGDIEELLKKGNPQTKSFYVDKKPVFENGDYKIYDELKYLDIAELVELHNDNMIKQRESSYFKKIIDKNKSVFLVAKDNKGKIVGYILTRPEYSPFIDSGLYNVMNFVGIVVSPSMRGKGLGRKLINMMEERVKKMNQFEYIYGHVRFSNKSAKRLYKKMGYSLFPIGRYKDTKEIKYRLFKRLKRPDFSRSLKTHRKEIMVGLSLLLGHELIHLIREY